MLCRLDGPNEERNWWWRRFDSEDIRYVANKLGIQVNTSFGGRGYDSSYYADLEPVFDNIGIELDHDDSMDVDQ